MYRKRKINLLAACSDANLNSVREICNDPKRKRQLSLRDNHNWSPLHHAVATQSVEIVRFILEQKGPLDIRAESFEGQTALFVGCCMKSVPLEIIALLIAKDPDLVNWVNNEMVSPLQQAANYRRLDVVRLLIEKGGADPNWTDLDGEHVLFYAVYAKQLDIINYLMFETNCDMQHRNVNGITAADLLFRLRPHPTSDDYEQYSMCMLTIFYLTYDEFTKPEFICQHIRATDGFMKDYLMMAVLELFYLCPRYNSDHCTLVRRILAVDLHYSAALNVSRKFRLCRLLNSKVKFDMHPQLGSFDKQLDAMFRLFVYDRDAFDEYLPLILRRENPPIVINFVAPQFVEHAGNLTTFHSIFKFFNTLSMFGIITHDLIDLCNINDFFLEILLPLTTTARPFIFRHKSDDALVSRHFEETDSIKDRHSYSKFVGEFKAGNGYGFVPKLFNLSRTVVREIVFNACPVTDTPHIKLSKLLTLEVPASIQNRLAYNFMEHSFK